MRGVYNLVLVECFKYLVKCFYIQYSIIGWQEESKRVRSKRKNGAAFSFDGKKCVSLLKARCMIGNGRDMYHFDDS